MRRRSSPQAPELRAPPPPLFVSRACGPAAFRAARRRGICTVEAGGGVEGSAALRGWCAAAAAAAAATVTRMHDFENLC